MKIESIFIDSPQADRFTFELLLGNQVIFTLTLSRNKTPYDLPDAPLSDDVSIRITARDVINLVRIVCKPVAILETIYSIDSEEEEKNQKKKKKKHSLWYYLSPKVILKH